jgi:hypothetical protein
MGIMTALVMNYTVNPLWDGIKRFGKGVYRFMEMAQYARAAAVLAQQGHHELAKHCMMEYNKIKASK